MDGGERSTLLATLGAQVAAGELVPFLGPGVLAMGETASALPTSPVALVARLAAKVGIPGRIRNNLWGAAQYIETNRHRVTLEKIMNDVFAVVPEPGPIHRWLASLTTTPLVIDTWYDGVMARAYEEAGRRDVGHLQGVTRNGEWREIWYRFYHPDGSEAQASDAGDWATILYKPHGSVTPAKNYLISDSDYVEVLTEIDIQTPIPDVIKELRAERGFLFLGCRFDDQMLRTFARQIIKRSKGPHYAVLADPGELTRNEEKFLVEQGITPIFTDLASAAEALAQVPS